MVWTGLCRRVLRSTGKQLSVLVNNAGVWREAGGRCVDEGGREAGGRGRAMMRRVTLPVRSDDLHPHLLLLSFRVRIPCTLVVRTRTVQHTSAHLSMRYHPSRCCPHWRRLPG